MPLSAALYAACSEATSVTFEELTDVSRINAAAAAMIRNETSSAIINAAPFSFLLFSVNTYLLIAISFLPMRLSPDQYCLSM